MHGEPRAPGKLLRATRLRRGKRPLDDDPPASLEEAQPRLIARVRDLDSYGIADLLMDRRAPAPSFRPLNDDLALEVTYGEASRTVAAADLERWGIELDDALKLGRANLREATDGTFERVAVGAYVSPWQDSRDASRLILTELIVRLELRGEPVALLPTRDHLLLAGSDDVPALRAIARLAGPLLDSKRRFTGYAFIWLDRTWQRYLPSSGHPLRSDYERLARITTVRSYAEQLAPLQACVGRDVFVAEVRIVGPPALRAQAAVATWPAGPTLLPQADLVAVVAGDGTSRLVAWEDLLGVWGEELEPQGLKPERWRAERHPPLDVVDRIASQTLKT